MACSHGHHHHGHHLADGKMGWAVLITAAFVLGEGIAGFFGHSVALLSVAGHNLADALAMLLVICLAALITVEQFVIKPRAPNA